MDAATPGGDAVVRAAHRPGYAGLAGSGARAATFAAKSAALALAYLSIRLRAIARQADGDLRCPAA